MGMGMAPASCWTISTENVKKEVPKQFAELERSLAGCNVTLEDVAIAMTRGDEVECDDEDAIRHLNMAFDDVISAFKKKTKLNINIAYHNSMDEGDRYDDVNGVYWELDGVTALTPAGKKMKGKIQYSRWVIWG